MKLLTGAFRTVTVLTLALILFVETLLTVNHYCTTVSMEIHT